MKLGDNAARLYLEDCEAINKRLRGLLRAHEEIFAWLLGENGDFPESLPGKRYNFRTELRRRLEQLP